VYIISSDESLVDSNLGKNITVFEVSHKSGVNPALRIPNYFLTNIKLTLLQVKLAKKVDHFVFFLGGETLILQMLFLRVIRKRVVLMVAGTPKRISTGSSDILLKAMNMLTSISFLFADKLIVYSKRFVEGYPLRRYSAKVLIAHEHFLDFSKFTLKDTHEKTIDAKFRVGFIGRFSAEKGVLNFLEAIPLVVAKNSSVIFLIGGSGPLKNDITSFISKNNLSSIVEMKNWIQYEMLPNYLRQLDLLVIPSFTEGLPNILLEAMACGTPVLATNVGVIPEIIQDKETGFLLLSNSSEKIAREILYLIGKSDLLKKVSVNSQNYAQKNFTFQKTLSAWTDIYQRIVK
jgi:glycosyltransferase involved in cell wall biosynthesis